MLEAAVGQAVAEREQRDAHVVPVALALVLRLVRAGVRVDHRHLPDRARPGERQLAAGRDVAEEQPGDGGAALGAGVPDVEDRGHVLGRPAQVDRSAVHAPAARPACRSRRRPAPARAGRPGSSSDEREACSPTWFCHSPDHHDGDVGSRGPGPPPAGARPRRRSPPGRPARCRRTPRRSRGTAAAAAVRRARAARRRRPRPGPGCRPGR